jgi:hypothetical protein
MPYSFDKPTVNGSFGAWGTILNTAIDAIASAINAVETIANAALPKAGGTLTGNLNVKTDSFDAVDKGNVTTSVSFDLAAARWFYMTLTGAVGTVSFTNPPTSGKAACVILEIANGVAGITWPASVKWPGGTAPTLTSGTDIVSLYTRNGGTTWHGALAVRNSS